MLFSAITPTFAAELAPDSNFWRCSAYDAENLEWVIESGYKLTAINKAFDDCKKQSKFPKSCKVAKDTCELFVNGITTRPMFQCTALDRLARRWLSSIYYHPDEAAFAAKAHCQQNSSLPETCYVYMLTCRNLNPRE